MLKLRHLSIQLITLKFEFFRVLLVFCGLLCFEFVVSGDILKFDVLIGKLVQRVVKLALSIPECLLQLTQLLTHVLYLLGLLPVFPVTLLNL